MDVEVRLAKCIVHGRAFHLGVVECSRSLRGLPNQGARVPRIAEGGGKDEAIARSSLTARPRRSTRMASSYSPRLMCKNPRAAHHRLRD